MLTPTTIKLIDLLSPGYIYSHKRMSGMVEDTVAMASLNAAKQQIRSAMKNKLGALSHEAVKSQSKTTP